MIGKIKHKGLRALYESGNRAKLNAEHVERLEDILTVLEAASCIHDCDVPGLKLHQLQGKRKDEWSLWVNGPWRVTFRFEGEEAYDVNYEQYH